jgi:hypothetical protein
MLDTVGVWIEKDEIESARGRAFERAASVVSLIAKFQFPFRRAADRLDMWLSAAREVLRP